MDEVYLSENIVMDSSGNLWLIVADGEEIPRLNFEFDVTTGNCYIDESAINWRNVDYYTRNSNGEWILVDGGNEQNV